MNIRNNVQLSNNCSLIMTELGLVVFDEKNNLVISKKFDNSLGSYKTT